MPMKAECPVFRFPDAGGFSKVMEKGSKAKDQIALFCTFTGIYAVFENIEGMGTFLKNPGAPVQFRKDMRKNSQIPQQKESLCAVFAGNQLVELIADPL